MVELDAVDLDDLATALEDNSYESSWWLDPATGTIEYCSADDDVEGFEERDLLHIDPIGSHEAYRDMADFVDGVSAARARGMLGRAIEGRGAFRRFKDTLLEFPELQDEWFGYHARMMRRRAIEWLSEQGLVAIDAAEAALALLEDSEVVGPQGIQTLAATGLRALYGDRLVALVVFGSYARGDHDADSDLDLLVVLRDPVSPWDELRCLDNLLWDLSLEAGLTVSALPVGEEQWRNGRAPVLVEARAHGASLR